MKKLLPHPGLSVLLLLLWLLANNTFSPGHILLGSLLGIVIPFFSAAFLPEPIHLNHPLIFARYLGRLTVDIILANLQVAFWIIRPSRNLQPAFIQYSLSLDSPLAVSVLANTISLTPGTVSCDVSPDQKTLLIHSLHTTDHDEVIRQIHNRYETLLLEAMNS